MKCASTGTQVRQNAAGLLAPLFFGNECSFRVVSLKGHGFSRAVSEWIEIAALAAEGWF